MFNNSTIINNNLNESENSCAQIKQIITLLNSTIPLLWVILGTFTNSLSLIVFSRQTMRRNSTFFYLLLMTLSDLIVLWVGSFRDFLAYKFHLYISGTLMCRVLVFTFFVSCQFSSWLLTAANIDRLMFIISYNYSKKWCTKKIAYKVSFIILLSLILINIHFLIYINSDETKESNIFKKNSTEIEHVIHPIVYPKCQTKPGIYSHFYANYYSWIDSFVFSFIPFLIMLVCNLALVTRVFKTKKNLNQYQNRKESNKNDTNETSFLKNTKSNKNLVSKSSNTDTFDKMRNMAITIIGVTLLFIIFTVPINIYVPIMHSIHINDSNAANCDDLLFCILNNMVNANHSTSFFIYLTTNSKFKKEIKILYENFKILFVRNLNVLLVCCGFKINCVSNEQNDNCTSGKKLKNCEKCKKMNLINRKKNKNLCVCSPQTANSIVATYEQTSKNSCSFVNSKLESLYTNINDDQIKLKFIMFEDKN